MSETRITRRRPIFRLRKIFFCTKLLTNRSLMPIIVPAAFASTASRCSSMSLNPPKQKKKARMRSSRLRAVWIVPFGVRIVAATTISNFRFSPYAAEAILSRGQKHARAMVHLGARRSSPVANSDVAVPV